MNNHPVVIYSDSLEIEQSVQKMLLDMNMQARAAYTSDAVKKYFRVKEGKILLLCFDELSSGIEAYAEIFNGNSTARISSHRAIVICTEQQASLASRFCLEGKIDDYFIYYPLIDQARFRLILERSLSELKSEDEYHNCTSYLTALKQQSKILDNFVNECFKDNQSLIDFSIASFSKSIELFDNRLNGFITEAKVLGNDIDINHFTNQISSMHKEFLNEPIATLRTTLSNTSSAWSDEKFKSYSRLSRKIHVPPSLLKSLASRKILIVDDDELFRDIMVAMLEAEDYIVFTASGGEQALETMNLSIPDVVLLDIDMPGMSGIELLKIIRAKEEWDEIPVLMLTGVVDESTLSESIRIGANGFFAKPGSEIEGFETIDSLFRDDGPLHTRHKPTPVKLLLTTEQHQSIKPLVIDDDTFMLEIIASLLDNLGIEEWETTTTGENALQLLESSQNRYNVLIMDLNMPGMDGIELLRHLANKHYDGAILIISGYGSRLLKSVENLGSSHRLNLIGSLGKPITPFKLAEMLSKAESGQVHYDDEIKDQWLPSVEELHSAIEADEFFLHYQPKIEMVTMALSGVEALARWQHPEKGILYPDQFIDFAEQNGLIKEMTFRLICQAIDQHMQWKEEGNVINIAVNISAEILNELDFPEHLTRFIDEAGMQAKYLTLELTETGLIKNHTNALDILNRLKLRGFRLSIDDFGTGDASFLKLKQMPVDQLKIDREFMHGTSNDIDARAIVDASIILSEELDLEIVAEGVENLEDWNFALNAGCKIIQGRFMSQPIPADEIIPWVEGLLTSRKK